MKQRSGGIGLALASLALLGSALLAVAAPPAAAQVGTFQPVGVMTVGRQGPTLALLADGSVLVTGGDPLYQSDLNVHVGVSSTERFDPKTNQFVTGRPMTVARTGHLAALLPDGKVLVLGGADDQSRALDSAEMYDPATGAFTPVGSMSQPRCYATATLLLDGRVLVVGGCGYTNYTETRATAELFDPSSGTFQQTGALAGPRANHAAVRLADGRVAILGGRNGSHVDQRQVEIYDPTTGTFSPQGETSTGRAACAAFPVPRGKILLAGGWTGDQSADGHLSILDSIEIYDPATGQATMTGHLSTPRLWVAAVSLADGRLLLAGGYPTDRSLTTAELIDPVTGRASPPVPIAGTRSHAAAILLPDNRALIVGGIDVSANILHTAVVYVP